MRAIAQTEKDPLPGIQLQHVDLNTLGPSWHLRYEPHGISELGMATHTQPDIGHGVGSSATPGLGAIELFLDREEEPFDRPVLEGIRSGRRAVARDRADLMIAHLDVVATNLRPPCLEI